MEEQNGLYMLNARVAPYEKQATHYWNHNQGSRAGGTLTTKSQKGTAKRQPNGTSSNYLLPVQSENSGGIKSEDDDVEGGGMASEDLRERVGAGWAELASKVDELQKKMAEQFEDESDQKAHEPPVIRIPSQPTREQWDRRQTTHTPYEAWCPHCAAARAVHRDHP